MRIITVVHVFFILSICSIQVFSQTKDQFNGGFYIGVANSGGSSDFQVIGIYTNNLGKYGASDLSVGDHIIATNCRLYIVEKINGTSPYVSVDVSDPTTDKIAPSKGSGVIFTPTANNEFPLEASGLSEAMKICIRNYFTLSVDDNFVSGSGGMLESVYDSDANSKVDEADNSMTVNNFTVNSEVPEDAVFTDDQSVTEFVLSGTTLQLMLEGDAGGQKTVDLSGLDTNTDDQTAGEVPVSASGNLTSTDVQAALVELQGDIDGIVDTDDQSLTGATLTGTSLQIDIEGGNSATVDLAGLQDGTGSDDQVASEVAYDNSTSGLSATDVKAAIDELAVSAGSDDQSVTEFALSGTTLQLTLEGDAGGQKTVDLSGLDTNTDDQTAVEVPVSASGNLTSNDVQSALVELQGDIDEIDDTDNQNLMGATLNGTSLQIDIEGGNSATVDLAGLQDGTGSDNQVASEVAYDNSTSGLDATNVKAAIDELAVSAGSDDQTIAEFALSGTTLQLTLEGDAGGQKTVDLSGLDTNTDDQTAVEVPVSVSGNLSSTDVQSALVELQGDIDGIDDTDDQNLTGATLSGTSLQIDIEGGNSATVDLAGLQDGTGSDNQVASEVAYDNSTSGLDATNVKAALDELAVSAGSDDQSVTEFALSGTTLQLTLEGDAAGQKTVDLSGLDTNTDDQTAVEVPVSASGNLTSTDVQSALVELQGDIDGIDDTDNQNLTGATLSGTSLQIDIEGGNSATVDLAGLQDGTGSDDQTAGEVEVSASGNLLSTDVQSALEELQEEINQILENNGVIPLNSITSAEIRDGTIAAVDIADNAITSAKIKDGQVSSADILDGAITSADIKNATITGTDIANETITGADIDDASITSADILNGTILSADIGNGQVTSTDIADGTIIAGDIASNAITSAKIKDGQVSSADILDGTITSTDIKDNSIISSDIANGAINSLKIYDGSVLGVDISNETITGANITNGTIASADIKNGTITAADLGSMGATSTGQFLEWQGSEIGWRPVSPKYSLANNFYTNDGLISGDRIVSMALRKITFDGTNSDIILSDGKLGIGKDIVTPGNPLHISNGTCPQLFITQSSTTSGIKHSMMGFGHYSASQKPVSGIYAYSSSDVNRLNIGGGAAQMNMATEIRFYTYHNTTTSASYIGPKMVIDKWGNVGIGTSTPMARLTVGGTITATGSIRAYYSDVAEWIKFVGRKPKSGEVVALAGDDKVKLCDEKASRMVAGIVTTKPGVVLGDEQGGIDAVRLALTGRVPVKVTGKVKTGDLLISAGDGKAMTCEEPVNYIGCIIGKATTDSVNGEVIALVSLK